MASVFILLGTLLGAAVYFYVKIQVMVDAAAKTMLDLKKKSMEAQSYMEQEYYLHSLNTVRFYFIGTGAWNKYESYLRAYSADTEPKTKLDFIDTADKSSKSV